MPLEFGKVALLDTNLKINDMLGRSTTDLCPSSRNMVHILYTIRGARLYRGRKCNLGDGEECRKGNSEANHDRRWFNLGNSACLWTRGMSKARQLEPYSWDRISFQRANLCTYVGALSWEARSTLSRRSIMQADRARITDLGREAGYCPTAYQDPIRSLDFNRPEITLIAFAMSILHRLLHSTLVRSNYE